MGTTVFERRRPADAVIEAALKDTSLGVFWLEDVARPEHPPLAGHLTADLVVVGGGYTGLWTALRAKERDPERRVVLLEASRVAWAASGRNGGFCETSLTHGHENGVSRWPEEIDRLEEMGSENLDGIEQTIARYDMKTDFERTGQLAVAVEPHQVDWLREEPGFLDRDAVRAEVHSDTFLAGAWDRDGCAMVHPAKLGLELARVAEELGVEIFEHSLVRGIEGDGSGPITLTTAGGRVTADAVALATNVFPSLLKRNRLMTVPVYDYVLMTEPLSAEQLASIGWSNRQGLADSANQFHYYRLTADDRILFGGYDAVYHYGGKVRPEYEDRMESHRKLASHFFTTFPQLEGLAFTHRWAGAIDSSSRFCAFFGTARRGRVTYATGFTGLGVGAARFAADVMLDKLSGEETERTELRMVREKPIPFPPEPAASIGVNLVRASMDRADHNQGRRNLFLKTLDAVGMGFDS
ncbi:MULTISPECIES: FAD-binding oxidoreductase [unclassified Microbacterium]|uniref:NAD(P)/FAD-dependent oxidoreductase n=1 Tax=unclassified Microbacterium TaxID=2609290 RepID=UPI000EA918FC|nr:MULTISPECIES: FAD-dependent oxidoreductase [unclassified Microbacterium]MBT2483611.1 FAD-dependent oxidoreductase [Microbacterium sp. ISL-108]RKN66618.1 FAD-dependent oxidoreductase [Microbacterium sp. CGR2]